MVKFSRFDAADYLRDETDIAACLEAAREERPDVLAAAQADAARASGEARFLVIEDKWTCNQVQHEAALLLPQARACRSGGKLMEHSYRRRGRCKLPPAGPQDMGLRLPDSPTDSRRSEETGSIA